MRFLTRSILLITAVLSLAGPAVAVQSEIGVLVLAHGGSPMWNKTVMNAVKDAEIPYRTLVYFGMGHNKAEVDRLQSDVRYLERKGATTIIVIPLLVSSYSEVYRQWRYLLGANVNPGFNTPFFPIEKQASIQFCEPFNTDPIVGLILLDRAREVSQNPEQETVFIVAHGPNDNADNDRWLDMIQQLGNTIKERGHFKSVQGATLRDDAPEEIRSFAVSNLRARVSAVNRAGGRALVIPMLMAPGGVENKISVALKGIVYTLNAKVLMPDHRISQWLRSKLP